MRWRIIIVALFILLHPQLVKAECYSQEIVAERVRILNIASNIDITSFYSEDGSNVNFSARIANLHKDIYIIEKTKNLSISYDEKRSTPNEIIISGYKPGDRLEFEIYPKNTACINDVLIHTRHVTLPYFNANYKDPICASIPDYYICKKWTRVTLTKSEFTDNITKYKLGLEKPTVPVEEEKDDYIDKIIDMIDAYYLPILGTIAVLGIIFIIKESRKNDFGF